MKQPKQQQQPKEEEPVKYKPSPMVNWFVPRVLFRAAYESVVSSLFGNFADRREMESALDIVAKENNVLHATDVVFDYSENSEDLWIDFVADTGDGFNSTYSVANLVAKDFLIYKAEKLPRGRILIFGGDQIYPAPTSELYEQKFRIPWKAALPAKDGDKNCPHLFAIPGNHDWYDGLGNFLKVFCQQRWIGNWETQQRRSYFVLKLPHNHWLWAIDIQLNEDIDEPQKQFFKKATEQMNEGDKVILVTAKPAWIYKEEIKKDTSYKRLKYFVEQYITDGKASHQNKKFTLLAILTGDLHHYSHYVSHDDSKPPVHFICAGGGGAALQLTHNLPATLDRVEAMNNTTDKTKAHQAPGNFCVTDITQQKVYPSAEKSKQLVSQNLLFFYKNWKLGLIFAFLYCFIYWIIESRTAAAGASYMDAIANVDFGDWVVATRTALGYTPLAVILCALLIIGLWSFGDNKKYETIGPKIYSLVYGFVLCALIFLLLWFFASFHNYEAERGWGWLVVFGAEIFFAGLFITGFVIGIYLYSANLLFKNHTGDASASLVIEDYKNFLRMHIDATSFTIYPFGIDKVTKKWQVIQDGNAISFKGDEPNYHLIEEPIKIAFK
ncbi:MAG: metallophosphoesterase [Bacteroidota bacterium]